MSAGLVPTNRHPVRSIQIIIGGLLTCTQLSPPNIHRLLGFATLPHIVVPEGALQQSFDGFRSATHQSLWESVSCLMRVS